MLKTALQIIFLSVFSLAALAQKTTITGTIADAATGETLIGANVIYAEGKGAVTDFNGNYSFEIEPGEYTVSVSFVGYQSQEKKIKVGSAKLTLDFQLKTMVLNEVTVVADIALGRETPVAFSNIEPKKLKEELASQDLPMILNSTPGVYATQQGGAQGDARITIRGFNQRNVAVMIDGVPMNDMENGWVYWSNWFGLDAVTQKIQVQRGLGASKLAIPAIGGTMNILTQGIESKAGGSVQFEMGSNNFYRATIGFNSGKLKGGWGITGAASYLNTQGWVDQTWAKQWFYFAKIQKTFKKHSLTLSAMGAPQERALRQGRQQIPYYDVDYAKELGVSLYGESGNALFDSTQLDKGLRYNREWGYLTRTRGISNPKQETMNSRTNFYHKPVFNLKHFWNINDNSALSTIVYASLGNGGGTRERGNLIFNQQGQINWDTLYNVNIKGSVFVPPYDLTYVNDTSQYKSTTYIQAQMNDHLWYGLLSTYNLKIGKITDLSIGLDLRSFQVWRYSKVVDFLGGDYAVVNPENIPVNEIYNPNPVKRSGDTTHYYISTKVKWAGLFAQAEFTGEKLTGFISASGALNAYYREDRMRKKNLVLADTTIEAAIGINDTLVYNGKTYTTNSEEAEFPNSGWLYFPGFTVKAGLNYKINRRHNVFINTGYLSRPQLLSNVYSGSSINTFEDAKNENILGIELGYSYASPKFSANLNLYNTYWLNKPVSQTINTGGTPILLSVPGLNANHRGVEVDFAYNILNNLTAEGTVSLGDWRWQGEKTAYFYTEDGILSDSIQFNANNVKVGDAAQTQLGASIRYEPLKNLYIKPRITYFDNHYADFAPEALQGENGERQSWKMPSYYLVDLHVGYTISLKTKKIDIRGSVLNLLNCRYISDARNNEFGSTFNAQSAGVFFGMGIRWNASVAFRF
ncbi:MAG: Vitamin B12 transporter BtuB [Bacteroidia bacterium]|nr:Vitamin B12 transporter BtuB [Bacteroidia bacterium]